MSFNLGNAMKYIWRADEKANALEDLEKAAWYINREIARRTGNTEELAQAVNSMTTAMPLTIAELWKWQ